MGDKQTEGQMEGDATRGGGVRLLLLAAAALCLAVAVGYCVAKRGYFVDEVWSYGYANSHYARVLSDVTGGDLSGATLTRQDLLDYLSVGEGERLDVGSVLHNQAGDLHPPLFGLALNAASSLAPGTFSKWAGLGLNLACHAVALLALWALLGELGCSSAARAAGVLLWGLSRAGLSDVLYIRMYEMLTALTLLLALELAALLRRGASGGGRRLLPAAVGATVFLGLMTQYYFAIYAFLACLAAGTHLLRRRRLGEAAALAACALAGVGLFLLAWPPALSHLGAGSPVASGKGALAALLDVAGWPERLLSFLTLAVQNMLIAVVTGIVSLWAIAYFNHSNHDTDVAQRSLVFSILVPASIYFLIVSLIALYQETRYIYNICPMLAVGAALSLDTWLRSTPQAKRTRETKVIVGAVVASLLLVTLLMEPDHLGKEEYAQQELMARYATDPCVYVVGYGASTGSANLSITADLTQLMEFGDVHVESDPSSEGIATYLASKGDPDEVILYVDMTTYSRVLTSNGTPSLDGETVSEEVTRSLGYSQRTLIKSTDLDGASASQTYLLTR